MVLEELLFDASGSGLEVAGAIKRSSETSEALSRGSLPSASFLTPVVLGMAMTGDDECLSFPRVSAGKEIFGRFPVRDAVEAFSKAELI